MNKILFHTGWTVRPGVPDPFGVIFGSEPEATPVTLPQDAMILEARRPDAPSGNQTGYYPVRSYTYEKRFFAPLDWKQKQNTLEFEGVMAQAMVYLNGELIAVNHYGYSQFYAQLNSRLRYGEENVLQVIARSNENASRWYPGAGIYRDVWLWQGERIHVPPEGVRLTTAELEEGYALVLADVAVENTGLDARKLRLRLTLTAPDGRETAAENLVSILQTETVQSRLRLTSSGARSIRPSTPMRRSSMRARSCWTAPRGASASARCRWTPGTACASTAWRPSSAVPASTTTTASSAPRPCPMPRNFA